MSKIKYTKVVFLAFFLLLGVKSISYSLRLADYNSAPLINGTVIHIAYNGYFTVLDESGKVWNVDAKLDRTANGYGVGSTIMLDKGKPLWEDYQRYSIVSPPKGVLFRQVALGLDIFIYFLVLYSICRLILRRLGNESF